MVGVIGAGAMGAALTVQLSRAGRSVTVFATAFDEQTIEAQRRGEPHPALGVPMPGDITIVEHDAWKQSLGEMETLVLAVSTAGLVATVRDIVPHVHPEALWVVATKGWDEETLRSAAALVAAEIGAEERVVAVVGPSLATEIAQGVPTAVVCASVDTVAARRTAELFGSARFRTYTSTDVAGVEVGAILKNVYAIAIGMCDGLADELGVDAMLNTKAFVFSRGLVEMSRMARALGGRAETVLGLSGAGDLFVTALGGRNGRFGRLVGQGMAPDDALREMSTTVEGYANARAATALAARNGLELPVLDAVAKVLYYGMAPKEAIERLMSASVEEELA